MWWPAYSNKLTLHVDTIEFIKMIPRELYRVSLNYTILDDTEITRLRVHQKIRAKRTMMMISLK